MTDMTDRKPPRMRPWLRVLLGISLALNLAVAGLAIGAAIRFGGAPEGARPPLPLGAMLYRELPREDRRALRDSSFGPREERAERRRADAAELDAALRAVPFDSARVEAFLAGQARRHSDLEQAMRAAWLRQVAGMSDAARAAFADRLSEAMVHHDRHHSR
ncbi:periplasmic heavy metal sensor [Antarcticimicrobium luteum]|uniref:Periplasmic heavy metal sensor n=1 Tax=Antarcticimicrobium luteum TaxID=2547397 RepID=A0A4R5V9E4_9RHOB|nr:periplasmic heavy metal sensor [Antarcticimicrobium luteum]TDK48763.1 periplasmic heavy metal sensor [Antarcticimicrobium luteum]